MDKVVIIDFENEYSELAEISESEVITLDNNVNCGLDLYYLIVFLQDKQITIIELGNKVLYEGNSNNCNFKRAEYEVINLEKIHYDNSYIITVIIMLKVEEERSYCVDCDNVAEFKLYDEKLCLKCLIERLKDVRYEKFEIYKL